MPRFLSWSAALSDLRRDRAVVPVGLMGARSLVQTYTVTRKRPLVVAGRFDRSAVMAMAVLAARAHQERTGATWAASMSVALKAAWQVARTARTAAAH